MTWIDGLTYGVLLALFWWQGYFTGRSHENKRSTKVINKIRKITDERTQIGLERARLERAAIECFGGPADGTLVAPAPFAVTIRGQTTLYAYALEENRYEVAAAATSG